MSEIMEWIDINKKLPKILTYVLVTINYDENLHIAYLNEDDDWCVWIDDELNLIGDAYIENEVDGSQGFGVIAWMDLPKHAEWKLVE
ncbi:unnamed protein product [marine sediment metagenome]|uniref:Uncharacterized protein n=1 Tax=marine sediment metagenome TaxID=412755 RepID=X0SFP8_9ZZZZ